MIIFLWIVSVIEKKKKLFLVLERWWLTEGPLFWLLITVQILLPAGWNVNLQGCKQGKKRKFLYNEILSLFCLEVFHSPSKALEFCNYWTTWQLPFVCAAGIGLGLFFNINNVWLFFFSFWSKFQPQNVWYVLHLVHSPWGKPGDL